ncbi:tRNA pseudouridine(38-40) synthase TruA [Aurantivibrio infirmus]
MYTRNCELKPGMEFPEGMRRMCLSLEYNGAGFHGFQAQKSKVKTIQSSLEEALSSIADEPIKLVCAGRTDAGVHATSQIIHFDTLASRPDKAWTLGANARLDRGVSIKWAKQVTPNFHARFSAKARTYRYLIFNHPTRPALLSDQITWQKRPLDFSKIIAASNSLLGEKDFSSFRSAQCQARNPVRTIHHIKFARSGDIAVMEVRANAFLHHMIRNIIGVLFAVGAGDKPPNWVEWVLDARDRTKAGVTGPPHGLYLTEVEYDHEFGLPNNDPGPYFLPAELDWIS